MRGWHHWIVNVHFSSRMSPFLYFLLSLVLTLASWALVAWGYLVWYPTFVVDKERKQQQGVMAFAKSAMVWFDEACHEDWGKRHAWQGKCDEERGTFHNFVRRASLWMRHDEHPYQQILDEVQQWVVVGTVVVAALVATVVCVRLFNDCREHRRVRARAPRSYIHQE